MKAGKREEGARRRTGNSAPKISAVFLICPGEGSEGDGGETERERISSV